MASPRTIPPIQDFIPPLEPGDHLTRREFERRYNAMPDLKKAELIEGVVYMPSPIRWNRHAGPQSKLSTWLGNYETDTPGVEAGSNATVRLDLDNEPQPDAVMIISPRFGGKSTPSKDDYLEGAPELVCEVASSTASFDLHTKFRVYRRNQVREYIVWRVLDRTIDWFVLRGPRYRRLPLRSDGVFCSEVFPGLWLDAAAMTDFKMKKVRKVLQQGLATPEHSAFVARLEAARKT